MGKSLQPEDLDTFLIKKLNNVEFGLKIKKRKYEKLSIFDFKIEDIIDL